MICQESPEHASARIRAVIDNPAIADWFFYKQFQQFLKCFYLDILGAKDYWLRFESSAMAVLMCMVWLCCLVCQICNCSLTLLQLRRTASKLLHSLTLSSTPTLLFCLMEATCQKHLVLRQIHLSATGHMQK